MRSALVAAVAAGCSFERGTLAPITDAAPTADAFVLDVAELPDVNALLIDACATCPANDIAGGAISISATGQITADLAAAHDDVAVTCGMAGGRDIFYELVVATGQVVYLDTFGSAADTAVAIYAAPCLSLTTEMACSNHPCASATFSQFSRSLSAGTYCVVVDEGASALGASVVLDVFFAGRDGSALTGSPPYVVSGDTCTATDVTDPPCENLAGNSGTLGLAKDQMYFYTQCTASNAPRASTCGTLGVGNDSIMTMKGRTSTAVSCIDDGCGGQDRGSNLVASAIGGPTLVQVTVDGWNGLCGTYTLTVTP